MNPPVIRVMLVDDHAVVRSGFRRFLEEFDDIRVVAEAESGDQAYRRYIKQTPDVLVLDISMPDTSGLALMRALLFSACIRMPRWPNARWTAVRAATSPKAARRKCW